MALFHFGDCERIKHIHSLRWDLNPLMTFVTYRRNGGQKTLMELIICESLWAINERQSMIRIWRDSWSDGDPNRSKSSLKCSLLRLIMFENMVGLCSTCEPWVTRTENECQKCWSAASRSVTTTTKKTTENRCNYFGNMTEVVGKRSRAIWAHSVPSERILVKCVSGLLCPWWSGHSVYCGQLSQTTITKRASMRGWLPECCEWKRLVLWMSQAASGSYPANHHWHQWAEKQIPCVAHQTIVAFAGWPPSTLHCLLGAARVTEGPSIVLPLLTAQPHSAQPLPKSQRVAPLAKLGLSSLCPLHRHRYIM